MNLILQKLTVKKRKRQTKYISLLTQARIHPTPTLKRSEEMALRVKSNTHAKQKTVYAKDVSAKHTD